MWIGRTPHPRSVAPRAPQSQGAREARAERTRVREHVPTRATQDRGTLLTQTARGAITGGAALASVLVFGGIGACNLVSGVDEFALTGSGGSSTGTGGTGGCGAAPPEPVTCVDLTELKGQWSTYVEGNAPTKVTVEENGLLGTYVDVDTDAAFAFHLRLDLTETVDASSADTFQLALRALNTSPVGWQVNAPIVVLEDQNGAQTTYTPGSVLMPTDGVTWKLISLPLDGGPGWTRSGPDLDRSRIAAVEIRTDTWDSGFVFSADVLSFRRAGEVCKITCPAGCSGRGACDMKALSCVCDLGAVGADCASCAQGFSDQGECIPVVDGSHTEWPNATSAANSDVWLAVHHDDIQILRPKVFVLHFSNDTDPKGSTLIQDIVDAFADASRYHAYADETATPQLQYAIAKVLDLRDGVDGRPPPPMDYTYKNSTLFPRVTVQGSLQFDYSALFGDAFTSLYQVLDPITGAPKTLCEMVNGGDLHEVWIVGSRVVPDAVPADAAESKQRYYAPGTKVDGAFDRCAGTSCLPVEVPSCGRSLRITFIDEARGAGCGLRAQSRALEAYAARGVVPGLSEWFLPFAALNLDEKYGLPFASLYSLGCSSPPCAAYLPPDKAVFTTTTDTLEVQPFDPVCGNVSFPPNAAIALDYKSEATVMSSCATFGEGPCGSGEPAEVGASAWADYELIHGDCGGGFLTWWYQSMPAFGATKAFADGRKMKSVWPYLFY